MIPWRSIMRTISRVDAAHADGGLASGNRVATMIAEVPPGAGVTEQRVAEMIAAAPAGLTQQQVQDLIDASVSNARINMQQAVDS